MADAHCARRGQVSATSRQSMQEMRLVLLVYPGRERYSLYNGVEAIPLERIAEIEDWNT